MNETVKEGGVLADKIEDGIVGYVMMPMLFTASSASEICYDFGLEAEAVPIYNIKDDPLIDEFEQEVV